MPKAALVFGCLAFNNCHISSVFPGMAMLAGLLVQRFVAELIISTIIDLIP